MTEASVESVPPDDTWARVHLARAEELIDDAGRGDTSPAGKQILFYSACIALMEAVLQAGGRRVKSGVGHHRLLIDETERLLEADDPSLFECLDDARSTRNDASYHAGIVSADDVNTLEESVTQLMGLVRPYLDS